MPAVLGEALRVHEEVGPDGQGEREQQQVDVPALYSDSAAGPYHYVNGINPKAIQALIPSAAISLLFAFLPALHALSQFSWFIAAGLGALFYYLIAPKGLTYADRDGEAIAVATSH